MASFYSSSAIINGTANADIILVDEVASGSGNTIFASDGHDVVFGDYEGGFIDNGGANNSAATALSLEALGAAGWSTNENPDVADDSVPWTSVLATGSGALDYFSVLVGAGETITVDLDYGGVSGVGGPDFDSFVRLLDATGVTLFTSDDDSDIAEGGRGSTPVAGSSSRDSFFTFTNNTGSAQTYAIEVSAFSLNPVPLNATYMLNVSVTGHAFANNASFDADTIRGDGGDDVLYGVAGDDTLDGGAGRDELLGGTGDDELETEVGENVAGELFDGGAGSDTLFIEGVGAGAEVVDLTDDEIVSIEALNLDVTGTSLTAEIDADQILAAGINLIQASGSAPDEARVEVDLGTQLNFDVSGLVLVGFDTSQDGFDLIGGGDANNIVGGATKDALMGGAADDTLEGGAGGDLLDGGLGAGDTASYASSSAAVTVSLLVGGAVGGDATGDTLMSIENLSGSIHDDIFAGDGSANVLRGLNGDDELQGHGGLDQHFGGAGDDEIRVGAGEVVDGEVYDGGSHSVGDTLRFFSNDVTDTYDFTNATVNDIEKIHFDDANGGGANVTMLASQIKAGVSEVASDARMGLNQEIQFNIVMGAETSLDLSGVSFTGFTHSEDIIGIAGDFENETITGSNIDDTIAALGGNDVLNGGGGQDEINGEAGDDVIVVDDGDAFDIIFGGPGVDTLDHSATTHGGARFDFVNGFLSGGLGAMGPLALDGIEIFFDGSGDNIADDTAGAMRIDMGDGDDEVVENVAGGVDIFNLGAGDDVLTINDAHIGLDLFDGGAGTDTIDFSSITVGGPPSAIIDLVGGTITDGTNTETIANFERVIGSARAETMLGTDGRNVLDGGAEADNLQGRGGDDTLLGGGGDDVLSGGLGDNVLRGQSGDDQITSSSGADVITGGAGDDVINGGGGDELTGGFGIDELFGGDGSDTLRGGNAADRLDGGAGADALIGGLGADDLVFGLSYDADVVTGFQDNVDTLELDDALWGGGLTVAQVLSTFATQTGPDTVFNFGGGDILTVSNTAMGALSNDILIF